MVGKWKILIEFIQTHSYNKHFEQESPTEIMKITDSNNFHGNHHYQENSRRIYLKHKQSYSESQN